MAKEKDKKHEKQILDNVPAEAVKWLKQPYNLTFLRGELSMSQLNVLVELVSSLQVKIEESLANSRTLFTDEDYDPFRRVQVRIPLKEVAKHASQYEEVKIMAKSLLSLQVEELKVKDGERSVIFKNVFSSVEVPLRVSEEGRKSYKKGYIEFVIDRDMAENVFALNRYNQYIKSIAKNRKSAFTSRIYMFITAFRKFGVWKPTYEELHKLLGFTVYEDNKWVVNKYPEYRHFKRKVLNVARDELKELADAGQVDCFFDFEEEYPEGGKKADGPHKIIFTIHTTELGKDVEQQTSFNKKRIEIEGVMRNDFDLKTSTIIGLLKLVDPENADYLLHKMQELKVWMKEHENEVGDARKYVVKSIRNALMDLVPVAEEVKEAKGEPSGTNWGSVDGEKRGDEGEVVDMTGRWMKAVGMKNYMMYLKEGVKVVKKEGKLVAVVKEKDVREWMEKVGKEKLGVEEIVDSLELRV